MDPQYAKLFNIGPFKRTGDGNTLNNTRYDADFQQIHARAIARSSISLTGHSGMATVGSGAIGAIR